MEATFELGNPKTYNMLILGALIKARGIGSVEAVMKGLKKTLPERHHHLLGDNEKAIRRGMELVE